jgi:hypothetical protein
MKTAPPIAPDAAMVLGIASTAMPFARTPAEAAERWLRVLRLNGEVATALEALGVSEAPLQALEDRGAEKETLGPNRAPAASDREPVGGAGVDCEEAVSLVTEHAVEVARERGATEVATTDLLVAVIEVYGADFDRVLCAHGANCDELIEQLGAGALSLHAPPPLDGA